MFEATNGNLKTKKCVECNISKPLSLEHFEIWYRSSAGREPRHANSCKVCRKKGMIIIKEWKKNNPLPDNYDCPICNKNEKQILEETGAYQHSNVNRSLFNVDHDHKTGKVRGWVCTYCNNMLARSRDNPETLINGAKYLKEKIWQTN
tara:strand:- start:30 stop:473 length:444 start_codon:yes stop_codon:yes gene_type:complete